MAIIGPSQTVSQINLYDFNGEMIGAGKSNMTAKIALENKSWYRKVLRKNGDKYLTAPHPEPLVARVRSINDDSIYVSRGINDDSLYLSLCRVMFDRNCDTIYQVFS